MKYNKAEDNYQKYVIHSMLIEEDRNMDAKEKEEENKKMHRLNLQKKK